MAQKRKFQRGGKNQRPKEASWQGKKSKKVFQRKTGTQAWYHRRRFLKMSEATKLLKWNLEAGTVMFLCAPIPETRNVDAAF